MITCIYIYIDHLSLNSFSVASMLYWYFKYILWIYSDLFRWLLSNPLMWSTLLRINFCFSQSWNSVLFIPILVRNDLNPRFFLFLVISHRINLLCLWAYIVFGPVKSILYILIHVWNFIPIYNQVYLFCLILIYNNL